MFFGSGDLTSKLAQFLLSLPAVLWAISFHEFCHGYVAMRLGDPTAKLDGRLSLNPLDHIDPVGALFLLLFRFGWAKPVPINPSYFKHPKRDMAFVSLAGAAGNLLTAFVCIQLVKFFPFLFQNYALQQFMLIMIYMNVGLYAFLPNKWLHIFYELERYGMFIIFALVLLGIIPRIMNSLMGFVLSLIY
jgi:Zn-dependent protease